MRVAVRMEWTSTRSREIREVPVHCVEQSRGDGTPRRLVRNARHKDGMNAWRRLHMDYAPVTSATAQGFMKKSLVIPSAKMTAGVSSTIQMLEELKREYEEHSDTK